MWRPSGARGARPRRAGLGRSHVLLAEFDADGVERERDTPSSSAMSLAVRYFTACHHARSFGRLGEQPSVQPRIELASVLRQFDQRAVTPDPPKLSGRLAVS